MAEALKSKPTYDRKTLSWRGVIVMILVLFIGVIAYFAFPYRTNQKRLVGLYLSKAKALARHDEYDKAAEALQKGSLADPHNLQLETEQLKVEIFQITKHQKEIRHCTRLETLGDISLDSNFHFA